MGCIQLNVMECICRCMFCFEVVGISCRLRTISCWNVKLNVNEMYSQLQILFCRRRNQLHVNIMFCSCECDVFGDLQVLFWLCIIAIVCCVQVSLQLYHVQVFISRFSVSVSVATVVSVSVVSVSSCISFKFYQFQLFQWVQFLQFQWVLVLVSVGAYSIDCMLYIVQLEVVSVAAISVPFVCRAIPVSINCMLFKLLPLVICCSSCFVELYVV